MNAIVRKMRARFKNGSPVALMCYAGGAFFFVDRYGVVVAPRGTAGLNREQSQAAIDNGELTECSTPLAHELRGRGGVVELGGWRFMRTDSRGQTPCDDWNDMSHLYEIAARFKRVQIESGDALDCIRRYDTPKTLFYVDPPYVQETRSGRWRTSSYVHEMDDAAHRELASALHAVQGMVILSGYPSPLYDELYAGWCRVETTARTDAPASNRERTEVLWISPNTVKSKAAHCYTPAFQFESEAAT